MINKRAGIVEGTGGLMNNFGEVHLGGETGKLA